MQVAGQPHPLLQRRPPANRAGEYQCNHANRDVTVGGAAASHGRPQLAQEGRVGRAGESGKSWARGGGEIMDGLRDR